MIFMLVVLARGCQLLCTVCLLLVPLDKDRGCLFGDGAVKIHAEAPGPLLLQVDMMLGKSMLRQVRLNFRRVCLGSTWASTLAQKICHTAPGAGAAGAAYLGKCGTSGKWRRNIARDMKMKLMKGCALPNHCEAVAPLLNKETMEEE